MSDGAITTRLTSFGAGAPSRLATGDKPVRRAAASCSTTLWIEYQNGNRDGFAAEIVRRY